VADSFPAETAIAGADRIERRRGSRLMVEIPITVMGMDTLGEPFKESTVTASISCYGCKYRTRRYAPKDSLVTLEIKPLNAPRATRIEHARVVWVQRPRHHRETFQIGLDLETPGNVWGIDSPPADWFPSADAVKPAINDSANHKTLEKIISPLEIGRAAEIPSALGEWETLHLPGLQSSTPISILRPNENADRPSANAAASAGDAIAAEIALLRQQFTGRLETALLETLRTFSDLAGEIVKETREACRTATKEMESELQRIAREARTAGEKSVTANEASTRKIGLAKHRRRGP
jgi:hypothetical protein